MVADESLPIVVQAGAVSGADIRAFTWPLSPGHHIVALFQAEDGPGVLFGRRWDLYVELGNPVDHEYADIGLMEDVQSACGGLPAPDSCVPDANEVVWF